MHLALGAPKAGLWLPKRDRLHQINPEPPRSRLAAVQRGRAFARRNCARRHPNLPCRRQPVAEGPSRSARSVTEMLQIPTRESVGRGAAGCVASTLTRRCRRQHWSRMRGGWRALPGRTDWADGCWPLARHCESVASITCRR